MHIPVMLDEVIQYLAPKKGETHVDCTFGAGGYSKAILKHDVNVIAIDQDPSTEMHYQTLRSQYPTQLEFVNDNFSNITHLLQGKKVDGLVLDLGVSSMQLDQADRGFSFMRDGPLDMRMSANGLSAADIINNTSEEELANIIFEYGDERASRKIAKLIVEARSIDPITTTSQFAEIVRKAIGFRPSKIDTSTKTFQAIRICVNDELGSLTRFLDQAENVLNRNGRLVIVTFHSLEDRIVKRYLQNKSEKHVARSKYAEPIISTATYVLPTRKTVQPHEKEVKLNPRARSAKLRVAIKN